MVDVWFFVFFYSLSSKKNDENKNLETNGEKKETETDEVDIKRTFADLFFQFWVVFRGMRSPISKKGLSCEGRLRMRRSCLSLPIVSFGLEICHK